MYSDRGHIAHGKEAQSLGKMGQPSIQDYLETTLTFVNGYLNTLDAENWPSLSQMKIYRKT
jgi:hypothetical protein